MKYTLHIRVLDTDDMLGPWPDDRKTGYIMRNFTPRNAAWTPDIFLAAEFDDLNKAQQARHQIMEEDRWFKNYDRTIIIVPETHTP